ncbi:zinc finger protein 541 isoform X3 [Pangasianodon hypophthalmus]|uniref:zinc finger protein 541 isoform X3 n=1 Tax=Pangasianodon hypophthalmus TaxID=310915 RepID=UPI00230711D2|nr:zinc finger protein 541 isoform X3 [Pangasianodon hypophthalmus]
MAENEETTSHAFVEVMEPSDMNLPLLSETENLPDDVILISPLTPPLASLPALEQHQLWMDSECGVSSNTGNASDEPFSVKASDSVREMDPLFGSELIPTEVVQRGKVEKHECSECSKVFGTTYALNKHLLTHQPERSHVCNICQKGFKRHDHLTGHMLTHQKRKDYHCSHPGCQKMYCGYRSLKRHCATQHGTYLLPPSSQPSALNTQPCPPPKLPVVKDGVSTSADYHSYFPPPKPHSIFQFEGYTGCGTSYNNYTLAANLEDPNLSQVKLPVISQSWSLAADGDSCSLESAIDLTASHSMVMSNQWASTSSLGGGVVNPVEPETVHTWERNLDFLVTNLQTWKEAPSIQPSKEVTDTGMGSQPSSACPRRNRPILLKLSMRQHEPQNKQQALMSGEASCSKSNIAGSSYQMEPIIPPLPPASKSKTKKKRVKKKILKAANIPTPPLPSPRPTTQRRPRPRPAYLVSPSQVAMASFSKESAPSDTLKEGSSTAMTRNGRESGERTYLKYPPSRHAQYSPSHSQAPSTSYMMDQQLVDSISSTRDGRVDMDGDCYQVDQEVQLSPLVIPVSVPVSSKEVSFNKASGHTIEKQQNVKCLSKTSRHPGLLRSLITPNLAAGGYPSQLRSPTYLADHLLNFDPPPYTPPPMLSPLRPGTGLYFNTLPQYQPCLPPPSIYSASLDSKDGISLILDNTVVSIEPKINVGSRFQAEIPPLRNPLLILYDEHPAQLVWAPWGDLPTNPKTQQKVTEFLDMCCSSVLPGGGTNTELALHCLHEVQGDILAALDLLLVRGDYRTSCHPLSDYHYTGSDHWTAQEMRLFQKTLLNQTKDFQLIHQALQTKSVAQCVEYYYAMKKLKKFKQRCRGIESTDGAGKSSESHSATDEQYDKTGARKSLNTPKGLHVGHSAENWEYTCEECGRSGNAHFAVHFPFQYIFSFGVMRLLIYTLPQNLYVYFSGVFIRQRVAVLI